MGWDTSADAGCRESICVTIVATCSSVTHLFTLPLHRHYSLLCGSRSGRGTGLKHVEYNLKTCKMRWPRMHEQCMCIFSSVPRWNRKRHDVQGEVNGTQGKPPMKHLRDVLLDRPSRFHGDSSFGASVILPVCLSPLSHWASAPRVDNPVAPRHGVNCGSGGSDLAWSSICPPGTMTQHFTLSQQGSRPLHSGPQGKSALCVQRDD